MRTLNLSGFNTGDNLTLSISQGALTAGPINVPSWGGGGSGGTITIQLQRGHMAVAPDSARFKVDLSGSDFDTAGPGVGEHYDARLHELIYLWDFDDPGTWTAPENVLPAWKNRNVAKGPFVAHMYTQPGTYNPSVLVIEPSSGKTATASVEVIVANPDTVYSGANTICISSSGNFADAPAGAQNITASGLASTDAIWIANKGGAAKRWLFRRGEDFDLRVSIGSDSAPGVMFGDYGIGAKPVINGHIQGPDIPFDAPLFIGYYRTADPDIAASVTVCNLDFIGTHNPITTLPTQGASGNTNNAIYTRGPCSLILSNCDFTAFGHVTIAMELVSTDRLLPAHLHMDNCSLNDFGGQYATYTSKMTHADSSLAYTGCRLAQNPLAFEVDSIRSPLRSEFIMNNHLRGCDFFHTDLTQPTVKLVNSPAGEGAIVNVHSCAFEGGYCAFNIAGTTNPTTTDPEFLRVTVQNAIIDGNIYLGTINSENLCSTVATGVTVRNNLFVQPAIGYRTGYPTCRAMVTLWPYGTNKDPAIVGQPIRAYNNTLRVDRTSAQNNSQVPATFYNKATLNGDALFTNALEYNNIVHAPNLNSPITTFAPLSDAALWASRYPGRRPYWGQSPGEYSAHAVANGETILLGYWNRGDGVNYSQSDFVVTGTEEVNFAGTWYQVADGEVAISYGASGVTITNNTGSNWPISQSITFKGALGAASPLITTGFATPAGAMKDTKPGTGSAALGAALSGNVSYMDILGTTRSAPADKGAWEVA